MNTEILAYLNSAKPDFDSGFSLFCKYGRNRTAMEWIARRHDVAKLNYELGKLARTTEATAAPAPPEAHLCTVNQDVPVTPSNVPKTADNVPDDVRRLTFRTFDDRRTRRSDLPADLQEVFDRNAEDYKLRRGFHEKMKMATTDRDRAIFRSKVLETDARIRAGWSRIDNYLTASEEEKTRETFNESTYRSYLSKALRRENNSPKQIAACKARLRSLLEHGCTVDEKTIQALADKGLA